MTRCQHVTWAVLCLIVVFVVHATAPAADELVPEDTCIVELTLPEGSTVNANGDDYGTQREFTYSPLTLKKIYEYEYTIHYPSGKTSKHTLLLEGGRRVRLARRDPAANAPELVLQTGHVHGITSVAFSSDGRTALTGSWDHTAILWDVQTGKKIRAFEGHTSIIASVAFSSDGRTALTGSWDHKAILWDVQTGKKIRAFTKRSGDIKSVAFSPDGKTILTGSLDKTAILWDVRTGKKLRTLAGHSGYVWSVAFSPDGRTIATGSRDKTAILWDVQSGRKLRTFEGHTVGICSVAFSPDGRTVLTGSEDKTAILWDVQTGKKLRTFEGHPSKIKSVAFSPDGKTILTGSLDKTAILWDVRTGKKLRVLTGHSHEIHSVAFSPDGRTIVTGSMDKTAILWDVATGKKLRAFTKRSGDIKSMAISPDGRTILTSSEDKTAILWDVWTGKKLQTLAGHSRRIVSVAFSPDGRTVLTNSWDHTAILWDVQTGKKLRTFEGHTSWIRSLAFNPDGQTILTTSSSDTHSSDKTAILWNVQTGRKLRTFEGHTAWIRSVAFSPDGRTALTGSSDETAILWDVQSGRKLRTFEGHSYYVNSVAFSPDGRTALTGSSDKTAILWNVQTGEKLQTFAGHSDEIKSLTFSPDGRTFLTGSHDKTAILWDVQTGRKLRTFEGHSYRIWSVVFSPDGRTIWTCSKDGSTKVWSVTTGENLFTRLSFNNGQDWLVTTPEGLFDGSPGGMEKVYYRVGGGLNVVPVERFFQDFYRPELMAFLMRDEQALPKVEIGKQLPPEVRIVSPERGRITQENVVTVEAVIEDKGGGIKTPWIKQNGSRVIVDSKPVREGNRLRWKFELPLVDGENKIEVQSASADGSWESEPARVTLTRTTPTEKTELYLLAIGVSKYADESANLRYAAADAEAFAKLFRTRGADSYGEGRVHVQTLLDVNATSENIEQAIAKIAEKAKPQDVFMLTLSGHGIMVGQRYFFLPHEFTSKDEGGWKEDAKKYGLPGDELQTWINRVPALKRVVVYDTCQSGGAIAVASLSRDAFGFQRAFETFRRSTGCYIIAAATASQNAEEIDDIGHGALTYALLAGLGAVDRGPFKKRTADSKDGLVQVRDWLGFAQENVPTLTKTYYGHEQLVNVFGEGRSFPILRAKKEKQP